MLILIKIDININFGRYLLKSLGRRCEADSLPLKTL